MKIKILQIKDALSEIPFIERLNLPIDDDHEMAVLIIDPPQDILEYFAAEKNAVEKKINIMHQNRKYFIFTIRQGVLHSIIEEKETGYPDQISALFSELHVRTNNWLSPPFLKQTGYGLTLTRPAIMGILNVTPDSFSDGGRYYDTEKAVDQAMKMVDAGADIIDVGGESSRPGAIPVTIEQEIARVIPVIKSIRDKSRVLISVDTVKAAVAGQALDAGADWINDISALQADPQMIPVALKHGCPVIVMHMQGSPQTMQENPSYHNVCIEVDDFFEERISTLVRAGISRIILDPGIGFGKRLEDNLDLIRCAGVFRQHGYPLVYGVSRKSFLGLLTEKKVEDRLAGSLAAVAPLIRQGVNIVRVHDVGETRDMIRVLDSLRPSINDKI